jgi:hypothetical protein
MDQIIIFMALAEGRSEVLAGPLSMHAQTAIHIVGLMSGARFEVTPVGMGGGGAGGAGGAGGGKGTGGARGDEGGGRGGGGGTVLVTCDGVGFTRNS